VDVLGTSFDTATRTAGGTTVRLHHVPVLLDRALELWAPETARRVVDGTVGRAGHSLALLGARDDVRLLALDRDPDAVAFVSRRFAGFGERATCVHGSYGDLERLLEAWGGGPVDGILLDLGVSSPQIDDPARGFSTRADGPLDLRFDRTHGPTAAEWLARVDLERLARVLREYGEEPHPRRVARALLAARDAGGLATTARLGEAVDGVAGRRGDPAPKARARVFQAIRIAVNGELAELERLLEALPRLLAPGGRAAIISFHSLEDRLVKRAFRDLARDCVCPPELPICACGGGRAKLRVLTRHPITADDSEVAANPRARSAKLRAAERLATDPEAAA
jgi:16S rRNA (cytosine1402-N4)-methyltransferase